MLTDNTGPVSIDVPRDRAGTFEPQIVRKRQWRLSGVDEVVLSLYAKGLTTGRGRREALLDRVEVRPLPLTCRSRGVEGDRCGVVFTRDAAARQRYWAHSHVGWRVIGRAEPTAGRRWCRLHDATATFTPPADCSAAYWEIRISEPADCGRLISRWLCPHAATPPTPRQSVAVGNRGFSAFVPVTSRACAIGGMSERMRCGYVSTLSSASAFAVIAGGPGPGGVVELDCVEELLVIFSAPVRIASRAAPRTRWERAADHAGGAVAQVGR
ncbi:hypothetical protein GCM10022225_74090 [Plantactinospora mayteni]|uniref:Mutator family transposase n=1 Tax=Plantactinospora mayteni TaxID=566021 RepID=A0ABQ4EWA7_9ACTN|nr:hypothetical protein Pma05_55060 [Plantactinospora mayteni]